MIRLSLVCSVALAVLGLSAAFGADLADGKDPVVRKYLQDCDDAVAKFEKTHPAEVETAVEKLKKVHRGLYQCLLDHHGIWPQPPKEYDSKALDTWWKNLLLPFGVSAEEWDAGPGMSIILFDEVPLTAYRWKGQPWIMANEPGGWPIYGILADGSIMRSGILLVPVPKMTKGPLALDTGGSKPAPIPDEMKKAAEAK